MRPPLNAIWAGPVMRYGSRCPPADAEGRTGAVMLRLAGAQPKVRLSPLYPRRPVQTECCTDCGQPSYALRAEDNS
ncbi:hypothetical protein GCM10007886_06120 [Methylobacterium gregans]|nr:hypothetical protein GCM10007886_06120 [Methylobacterium gregans]